MKLLKNILAILAFFIILAPAILAHEIEDKSKDIPKTALNYIIAASLISSAYVVFSFLIKKKTEIIKWLLFLGIIIPIIIATAYSAGSTVYLNLVSESQGPVHWHADFEIWVCGKEIDLKDPQGLANRIGNPVFHEHGDDRIHVEGVLVSKEAASLREFFEVVGGELGRSHMIVPTNKGSVEVMSGDACPDGKVGVLQVFVYKVLNPDKNGDWVYKIEKLDDFQDYVLSPYSLVPPGDCIIVEFDEEKPSTDKICETYKVAINRGELTGS